MSFSCGIDWRDLGVFSPGALDTAVKVPTVPDGARVAEFAGVVDAAASPFVPRIAHLGCCVGTPRFPF